MAARMAPVLHMIALHMDLLRARSLRQGTRRPSDPVAEDLRVLGILRKLDLEAADRTGLEAGLDYTDRSLPAVAVRLRYSIGLEEVAYDHCTAPKAVKHRAGIHLHDHPSVPHCGGRIPMTRLDVELERTPGLATCIGPEADHRHPPWHSDLVFVPGSRDSQRPCRGRARPVHWSKQTTHLPRHVHGRQ